MKAKNWHDGNLYLVGLYAFPSIQNKVIPSPIPSITQNFELNIKALPKDIYQLKNYLNLSSNPKLKTFLPVGKNLGKQGVNYLTKENVLSILDTISERNPEDLNFSRIKLQIIKAL